MSSWTIETSSRRDERKRREELKKKKRRKEGRKSWEVCTFVGTPSPPTWNKSHPPPPGGEVGGSVFSFLYLLLRPLRVEIKFYISLVFLAAAGGVAGRWEQKRTTPFATHPPGRFFGCIHFGFLRFYSREDFSAGLSTRCRRPIELCIRNK